MASSAAAHPMAAMSRAELQGLIEWTEHRLHREPATPGPVRDQVAAAYAVFANATLRMAGLGLDDPKWSPADIALQYCDAIMAEHVAQGPRAAVLFVYMTGSTLKEMIDGGRDPTCAAVAMLVVHGEAASAPAEEPAADAGGGPA